ncbi:SulP family sulfate permease [Paenibacillus shirakamiensis]|uniref:SulP family sulfate permease n=1 Tax=Paenibacillus shirakamiensis TaxID=1265935 RepID=A0ABS4JG84_9BACL|nr:SulP family inorganic anion transporter [Paenibacillus shirakamiensis]MBP2000717.1 SulP family sulfate permease [Paenibacillus shirakamiensis]
MNLAWIRYNFFSNVRKDILSGLTVAFALIPEAIAFSIMAGVDPMVGLYASFTIAVSISFFGGRPGMISAATGAMASLMGPLIAKYGIEYLFAATIMTGILQWMMGVLKFGRFITFVPHPVMVGFVNALAIIVFMAQLPNFEGATWIAYALLLGTLIIVYGLPYLTKAVPSPLVAIIIMSVITFLSGAKILTVGDMGEIPQSLPFFHLPQVPFNLHTLTIIFPFSLALSVVGITESLLTATVVDDMTDTSSSKNKEIRGQGMSNVLTGLFGGMAGCAMIGQTVINVRSGGRTRLSTFVAGSFLLFLILGLGEIVKQIPMAALAGVMFMVSFGTFDWRSLRTLHKIPRADAVVMVVTVLVVVWTSNLALGVVSGVILSAISYGWRSATLKVGIEIEESGAKRYTIAGPLFFGTTAQFQQFFQGVDDPDQIIVDMHHSHVWDQSGCEALHKLIAKYDVLHKQIEILGLNDESAQLIGRVR